MKTAKAAADTPFPEVARGVPQGLELGLRNYWYPVLQSEELPADKPVAFKALGEELVAWRDSHGQPQILRDKCAHRGAKLSVGRVHEGEIQCLWHGLKFNGAGQCTLIPWEDDQSRIPKRLCVRGYPAREIGGYVWAYIGDVEKFPPPPLADCLPEELLRPDEFIWFRLPTDVWKANWLQCLDGSDRFHAFILHSESQAVANEDWKGGKPKKPAVPFDSRRIKIVDSPQGYVSVALDPNGEIIHHGHFLEGWKGERWTFPCLHTIPLRPVPNADPFASRLYQFPIDATHTQVVRFMTWRAHTEADRAMRTRLWDEVVLPRQIQVAGEDKMITEAIGDLAASRAEESLLFPDRNVVEWRRKLASAYTAQTKGERILSRREALVFPV